MMNDKDRVRLFTLDLFAYYKELWDSENYILSRRFKEDNVFKVVFSVKLLKKRFNKLNKIAICHTSDSAGLICMLRKVFDCEIIVLTNHPLFERVLPFLQDKLGKITYKKVDCVFEPFAESVEDCDLVIFPEMEYFVPLNLIKYKNKMTLCLYYVDDFNNTTEQNYVLCKEDMEDMCSFSNTLELDVCKNVNGRDYFYGLGIV